MAKRKADNLAQAQPKSSSKKAKHEKGDAVVAKRNLLEDSDSGSSSEDESVGGVQLDEPQFNINQEYANRFEHNKKREELHRLEEKFRQDAKPTNGKLYGDKYDEDSESSEDEDEDDDGFLATEDLDAEISATLQAIKTKDPRVYDEKVTFYKPIEEDGEEAGEVAKKDKPVYLSDYHRDNLLKGYTGEDEEPAPKTYVQEQDELQRSIVKEMHAAAAEDSSDSQDEDEGFLIPKSKPKPSAEEAKDSRAAKVKVTVDVGTADKEPDTFLSNFLQARAWVPTDSARFQPLESDDDEEEELADKFEAAYNLRFEDPTGSNEMLKSYARDMVAAKSVRREEPNSRKKQRDAQREKKEAEMREREVEKARLRQLKIGEMEEKLQKIKKAAGIKGKTLQEQEWTKFLDENWDDDKWEEEMNRRFGDEYYAEQENGSDEDTDDQVEAGGSKKMKTRKPKWDDDIDIKDLIPEFEEGSQEKPNFTLSDSDEQDEGSDDEEENDATTKKKKTSKDHQRDKQAKKKAARLERKKIEELVDSRIDLDLSLKSKQPSLFRYRETSPISFGLTARDILMAPDTSLNEFAGLKKMAAFRDPDKKRKDKKHLGKKARLRKWRRETFGNEDGPEIVIAPNTGEVAVDGDNVDIVEGKKKKKRSRKNKSRVEATA